MSVDPALISVVVPAYNAESTIGATLESIGRQTHQIDRGDRRRRRIDGRHGADRRAVRRAGCPRPAGEARQRRCGAGTQRRLRREPRRLHRADRRRRPLASPQARDAACGAGVGGPVGRLRLHLLPAHRWRGPRALRRRDGRNARTRLPAAPAFQPGQQRQRPARAARGMGVGRRVLAGAAGTRGAGMRGLPVPTPHRAQLGDRGRSRVPDRIPDDPERHVGEPRADAALALCHVRDHRASVPRDPASDPCLGADPAPAGSSGARRVRNAAARRQARARGMPAARASLQPAGQSLGVRFSSAGSSARSARSWICSAINGWSARILRKTVDQARASMPAIPWNRSPTTRAIRAGAGRGGFRCSTTAPSKPRTRARGGTADRAGARHRRRRLRRKPRLQGPGEERPDSGRL